MPKLTGKKPEYKTEHTLRKIIDSAEIIDRSELKDLPATITPEEVKAFSSDPVPYDYK